jgi:hypothetical protein
MVDIKAVLGRTNFLNVTKLKALFFIVRRNLSFLTLCSVKD